MSLLTLGTTTTTALGGFIWSRNPTPSNLALLMAAIKNDQINGQPIYPGAVQTSGVLYIPNRGTLQMLPGDVVGVDSTTGWPILISQLAITAGGSKWTHS